MNFSKIKITKNLIKIHGINDKEYKVIIDLIGREPSITELGIFSAMWNEHCSYKSTKKWLKTLPVNGPQVICGPGENAVIIDIEDGDALVFKIESHNHPSFIDPFQGAATGVGGILRDIFTMGARPIVTMNALSFGTKKNKVKELLSGVVKGIGSYGNSFGVPNLGGELRFDPSYDGNCLVNVFAAGIVKKDSIFYSGATGPDLPLVYLGAKTGRDGIGGATMASNEFNSKKEKERPTVQIGDPFMEKCLLEACLELMNNGAVISIQDMGAAGLTCSAVEMAGKGNLGVYLELDKVPKRETNMHAYEMMLSESQERMLMTLAPGKEKIAREIFQKWDLDFSIIGKTISEDRFKVYHKGKIEADLPLLALSNNSPEYDRNWKIKNKISTLPRFNSSTVNPMEALKILLSSPNHCSRKVIWEQFDHMVLSSTILPPGANAGIVKINNSEKAIACTLDCNPRYCEQDPILGGIQAVTETFRNLVISGAKPLAITNNLNFGNPEKSEIMGQIVGCIKGISEASKELNMPVVSGNVSLYNETNGCPILPTPTIGGVGIIKNLKEIIKIKAKVGDSLLLIGENPNNLGQSAFFREVLKISAEKAGPVPKINFQKERKISEFIFEINRSELIVGGHDVSDGGILLATAEICILNNIGFVFNTDDINWLFGENQGLYLIVCEKTKVESILKMAQSNRISLQKLGYFNDGIFKVGKQTSKIDELKTIFYNGLDDLVN